MNTILFMLFCCAVLFCLTISSSAIAISSSGSPLERTSLRQSKQCPVNICFVLDGSGSISRRDFREQIYFSLDIVDVTALQKPIRYAATQYGSDNTPISGFSMDYEKFALIMDATKRAGGGSAVSDGIEFCRQQFRNYKDEINMILLFTDGRYNLGVDPLKFIDLVKKEYKNLNVYPVEVGFASKPFFSSFPSTSVYEVGDFIDILLLEEEIISLREKCV